MARKKGARAKSAPTDVKTTGKGKRVIALQSFGGHPYGEEFEMSAGAEYERLKSEHLIRDDDRMTVGRVPESTVSPAPAVPEPNAP